MRASDSITNGDQAKLDLDFQTLRKILQTSPAGIVILNKKGRITYTNQYAEKILGFPQETILGRTYDDPEWEIKTFSGEPFPSEQLPFQIVKKTLKPVHNVTHRISGLEGEEIFLSIDAMPIFNNKGDFDGCICHVRDETEKQNRIQKLEKSKNQLRERVKELQALYKISTILADKEKEVAEILQEIANIIPLSFQYPENTIVEIIYKQESYLSSPLTGGKTSIHSACKVNGIKLKINVYYTELQNFLDEEQEMIDEITMKLGNFLQDKIHESQLRRREKELSIRNKLARKMLTVQDKEVYKEILDFLLKIFHCDTGYIGYINTQEDLVCPSMKGMVMRECAIPNKDIIFPKNHWGGLWGESLKQKKILWKNRNLRFPQGHIKLENSLCAPIVHQNKLIGQISLANKAKGFSKKDCLNIRAITEYLAPILHARIQRDLEVYERKKAEQKYRLIAENSYDIIFIINKEMKIEYYNGKPLKRILGYAKEDLYDKEILEYIHPKDQKKAMKTIKRALKTGKGVIEGRFRSKTGDYKWLEAKGNKFIDYTGEKKFIVNVRDITNRKMMDLKMRRSEKKYKFLFRNSPNVIMLLDRDTEILDINPAISKYININRENLIGKKLTDIPLKSPDKFSIYIKSIKNLLTEGELESFEVPITLKNNKIRWVKIKGVLIKLYGKTLIQVILQDITHSKQIRENLRRINRIKTEILRRKSHDLKTPLIAIKGFTDLILENHMSKLDEKLITYFQEIRNGSARLEKNIKAILEGSKIQNASERTQKAKGNLNKTIIRSVNELIPYAETKDIKIRTNLHDNLIISFVEEGIYEVMNNLISNAIKFTPLHGTIFIESIRKENEIIISVTDTGIGLTEEEQSHIFQKHVKIKSTKELNPNGTGLGLYISKKIIKSHNGRIWVESEGKNKGATFYFALPKME